MRLGGVAGGFDAAVRGGHGGGGLGFAFRLGLGDLGIDALAGFFRQALRLQEGACVFGYQVRDPERYGVVEFDGSGRAISLEEKPEKPRSTFAVTGLYFYDNDVLDIAAGLKPSGRGELEITDVNRAYMARGDLHVERLPRGIAWLDTGTHDSLMQASNFIHAIEERQGLMVACLEEIAYRMGYITAAELAQLARSMESSGYGQYLFRVLEHEP